LRVLIVAPTAGKLFEVKIFVIGAIAASVAKQLLKNSPQGNKTGIVDDDGFVAAETSALADEGGNVVHVAPLDYALGLDLLFELSAQ
jgi:hypothetical protein